MASEQAGAVTKGKTRSSKQTALNNYILFSVLFISTKCLQVWSYDLMHVIVLSAVLNWEAVLFLVVCGFVDCMNSYALIQMLAHC